METPLPEQIGFVYHCYQNKRATDGVLGLVRIHYPNAPIYLISDVGGHDMTDIAEKHGCKYVWSATKIGNGTGGLRQWLDNLRAAIAYCGTPYMVLLEDDVICNGRYTRLPSATIGGNHCGNDIRRCTFAEPLLAYIRGELDGKEPAFYYWSMAGGSIFPAKEFLECMDNGSVERVYGAADITHIIRDCGDVFLSILFMINGYTCEQWTNTGHSNMVHPDKRFY